ncbi:MAG TPA: Rap1a/Tai family immunity protein [Steroidobacteraceae bacterium]|nr:Rap1a/Tai family immunity protein [Steroidobacteraceae bacterium]
MTAEDLQQLCTGEDHVSRNACRIYILGVTQGIALGLHLLGRDGHPARPCVPAGVSAEALERTVKEKLADDLTAHPQDRQREAAGFISAALAAAFPCSKQ